MYQNVASCLEWYIIFCCWSILHPINMWKADTSKHSNHISHYNRIMYQMQLAIQSDTSFSISSYCSMIHHWTFNVKLIHQNVAIMYRISVERCIKMQLAVWNDISFSAAEAFCIQLICGKLIHQNTATTYRIMTE